VTAIDDVIRAFAEREQLFSNIGKNLPRLLVAGAWRQRLEIVQQLGPRLL